MPLSEKMFSTSLQALTFLILHCPGINFQFRTSIRKVCIKPINTVEVKVLSFRFLKYNACPCISLIVSLQIDVHYNVPDPVTKPAFQLLVHLKEPRAERNRRQAGLRERALPDDDDPGSHQDHREYKVTLEACTRCGSSFCLGTKYFSFGWSGLRFDSCYCCP